MPKPEELVCPQCRGRKAHTAKRCVHCAGSGHTPEQRDQHALCGARKKNGEACRAFAGQGTDHPGVGRCRRHLGATTNHKRHAVSVEVKRQMATLGTPLEDVTAPEALMGLLRASAGHVAWLRTAVAGLESLAGHEAEVLVRLYDSERDRLARIGEACIRAGVAERMVRMEQAKVETTLRAIREAAQDVGLNATELQALGIALRKRMAETLGDGGHEAEAAEAKLAKLRAQIRADDTQRINTAAKREAERLSGLTLPPEELLPLSDLTDDDA